MKMKPHFYRLPAIWRFQGQNSRLQLLSNTLVSSLQVCDITWWLFPKVKLHNVTANLLQLLPFLFGLLNAHSF